MLLKNILKGKRARRRRANYRHRHIPIFMDDEMEDFPLNAFLAEKKIEKEEKEEDFILVSVEFLEELNKIAEKYGFSYEVQHEKKKFLVLLDTGVQRIVRSI